MTFDEFKKSDLLKDKEFKTCKLSEIKDHKDDFDFRGIYILSEESGEVAYIGSAYARNLYERLKQYQQEKKGSGNSTLYNDLIDGGKTTEENARNYILGLTVNAFEDESLEYKLIGACDTAVNIAGAVKKRKKKGTK